ncbi:ArsR/SmtB family transcription factor [Lacipirellula limnantheis]|uniref:Cadmium resistance transcriptional regulatory protein CadC n=1 Tax=Lacipirellula limnantheis TaxID=2528024 RepID=A0A517TXZ6_9BACT|nr:metalloregulator ArsR/SmtB family transcription factor [Lacipirellula limnantheis]QDT73236.1 Cadmium resistance transcriptional regulatory protein CadC [Lacipirellula limnantheis]
MRDLLAITKALADENRIRAVALLEGHELCLCQIVEVLGLASSTVSRHMSILHQARLVETRKQGRWAYFRLADEDAPDTVRDAIVWVLAALARDKQGKLDRKELKAVLKMEPEELCRRQGECKC